MAARRSPTHDAQTRERIQTSQLVNRLQDNAMGKIELTKGQLKSIEILLKKTLPDLSSVALTGDPSAPITHRIILEGVMPK